jgi:hypothetical protein
MTSISIDRVDGLSSAAAIKGPCRVATTANIALYGQQTIDAVAVVTGDRVLVKNQTTGSENGIYVADTGQWRRAKDFSRTNDVVEGTQVAVTDGTVNGGFVYSLLTANPINVGVTSLSFGLAAGVQAAISAAAAAVAAQAAAEAAAAAAAAIVYTDTGAAIHGAGAKTNLADADEFGIWDTVGAVFAKVTLTNVIASIFKTARTIANAQFAAATFKLFNAAGTPRALTFVTTALTADRTLTLPDANVDLGFLDVKAWVNFNGTGTVAIVSSKNVSSITDNGVGTYTVNFTTALADANYAVVGNARVTAIASVAVTPFSNNSGGNPTNVAPTTAGFAVRTNVQGTDNVRDADYVGLVVLR